MIVQMNGGQVVVLSDEKTEVGFLVEDNAGLYDFSHKYRVYMEPPRRGHSPILACVPLNWRRKPNFKEVIRFPLNRCWVLVVI